MKKLAGVAVSTLLIASVLAGSTVVSATESTKSAEPAPQTAAAPLDAAAPQEGSAATPDETPAQDPYAAYLFVHFVDTEQDASKEQIYFSVSEDGTDWTTLNGRQPVLTSTVGEKGVRDPHIVRTPEGKFVIIATDLSMFNINQDWGKAQKDGSQNIVVWKSDTLTGFTGGGTLTHVGTSDALTVWAPESIWDVDKKQYMVTWASIVGDTVKNECYNWKFRIYRSYTKDFENFSEPEVYMEREDNIIDTTFYYNEANKMYYRFTKDEDDGKKWVFMEQGAHLDGDFELVATYSLDGKHYTETTGVEGPTVYKDNETDKWYLLLDNWTYIPYETDDITKGVFTQAGSFTYNGKTRSELQAGGTGLPQFRHGSVIPITKAEYDALLEKYPTTATPSTDEPDPDGKLIYSLDFEDDLTPATGKEIGDATAHGTPTFIARGTKGKKALQFDKDTKSYLSIPGSLFANRDCFSVSFMAKIPDKDTKQDGDKHVNWLFLVQADDSGCTWQNEKYLSVLWQKGDNNIVAQRFNITNGGRPDVPSDTTHKTSFGKWVMISVVYGKATTKLYINAELKSTVATTVNIKTLLGSNPVAYLGYATWDSGEYSYAAIDSFKVYDGAMTQAAMQSLLTNESLVGLE